MIWTRKACAVYCLAVYLIDLIALHLVRWVLGVEYPDERGLELGFQLFLSMMLPVIPLPIASIPFIRFEWGKEIKFND